MELSGRRWCTMSSDAVLSGDLSSSIARASKGKSGWTKAGLVTLSALSGASAAGITAVSAFVGYKVVKPIRRVLIEEETPPAAPPFAGQLPRQKVTFKSA